MSYTPAERISLKLHADLTEKWVQQRIAENPAMLGLGELVLRDKERIQPRAGRLDLLLQDPETQRRYEVELQLGATDESHIIRTIEYWDLERKRYPQYDHCAVLIAEDITSRFLNVVSLFNGTMPLIALQLTALKVGEHTTLVFTKIMDELTRGFVDEDEEAEAAPSDRPYWEQRASKSTVELADKLLGIAKGFNPELQLNYKRGYIGISKGHDQAFNFIIFSPKKNHINLAVRIPKDAELDKRIETIGLETLSYDRRFNRYRFALTSEDVTNFKSFITELMKIAYENATS